MQQAVASIDAALAAEARGADSKTDVTHLALVVAAVIYYARPFGPNERRPKKKRKVPPKGEPPLSTVDIGPLSKIISSKEGRRLHGARTRRQYVTVFPDARSCAVLPYRAGIVL
jgi:hypothetical protein